MARFVRFGMRSLERKALQICGKATAGALAVAALSALSSPERAHAQAEREAAVARPRIEKLADLPRYSYDITAKPSELLLDPGFVSIYGPRLRADTQALLANYDIQDRSLLRALRMTLVWLDLLDDDYESALAGVEAVRELHDKPGERLAAGLVQQLIAQARLAGGPDPDAALRAAASRALADLPFPAVSDVVKEAKARVELSSRTFLIGMVRGTMDEGAMATRTISDAALGELLEHRWAIEQVLPVQAAVAAALQAYVDANEIAKADIWAARSVDLTGRDDLSEVLVAVWDGGVDTALFTERLWTNSAEREDGLDNDANGYVDDLHGIGHEWDGTRTSGAPIPLGDAAARETELRGDTKGVLDINANIDSEEARAFKAKLGALEPDTVQPFLEALRLYGNHMHGTHVAGIVMAGNPAARLLSARITFPHQLRIDPYDEEQARVHAEQFADTIAYFKTQGVRVVNMSWGFEASQIERSLEMNGLEPDAEKRKERALAIFRQVAEPFAQAIANAPDMLFVAAAGNSNQDVEFVQFLPSGFELPNQVAVGAVDQAGDETSFTSYGKTVLLHANGFEVDSYVPGGQRLKASGTSMASPNVANLAAKMLAIEPSLTPPEVIALMREHAETTEDGRRFLIDPRATIDALSAGRARAERP